MHMLICAIVYARDEEEALEKGETIFGELVERGTFDYFAMFDDDTYSSPKERWGDIPAVVNIEHPDAKKLIDDAMDKTWRYFKENITVVRKLLDAYTDEEIFEEEAKEEKIGSGGFDPIRIARHYFYCIGQYKGFAIFLYDNDGEGIRTRWHLKNVLNKWDDEKYKDLDIWVVPADVHF